MPEPRIWFRRFSEAANSSSPLNRALPVTRAFRATSPSRLKQHLTLAGAGLPDDRQRFAGGQVQIHFRDGANDAFARGELHAQFARLKQGSRRSSAVFRIEHVAQPVAEII